MASEQIAINITANTKEAGKAILELQRQLNKTANIKSDDSGIKKELTTFKELRKEVDGILTKGKDLGHHFSLYAANAGKVRKLTEEFDNQQAVLDKNIARQQELQEKEIAGTITPNEVNELSRVNAIVDNLTTKQAEKLKNINAIKKKNSDMDKFAQAELNKIVDKYGVIKSDNSSILGLKRDQVSADKQSADSMQMVADAETKVSQTAKEANTNLEDARNAAQGVSNAIKATKKEASTANAKSIDTSKINQTKEAYTRLKMEVWDYAKALHQADAAINYNDVTYTLAGLIRQYQALKSAKLGIEKMGVPVELSGAYDSVVQKMMEVNGAINEYKRNMAGVKAPTESVKKSTVDFGKIARTVLGGIPKLLGAVKNGFLNVGRAIKKTKAHFDKMSNSMHRDFKHHLTSITKYVLGFRSLFFLVRRLRRYIGEGIKNMAKFNEGNNHVNASITRLLSSLLYLKNAWATAFSPILQWVTPVLEALIDGLAKVGNAFSRFLGVLTGKTSVFQAIKTDAQDYASTLDNIGSGAGSAADKTKKLTDRLAAFDDLNVLGKDNDDGAGGGGGGSGLADALEPSSDDMFTIVDAYNDLAQRIREAWLEALETGDFVAFGEKLGLAIKEGVINALKNIDWESLKEKAGQIGGSFGAFLASLFGSPDFWVELGTALGEAINTINAGLAAFLEQFRKGEYGKSIAEGLNSFFRTTDFYQAGQNINGVIVTLIDNINDFLDTISAEDVGKKIADFLEGLDFGEIVIKAGKAILKLGELIIEVAKQVLIQQARTGVETTIDGQTVYLKTDFDVDDPAQQKDALVDNFYTGLGEWIMHDLLGVDTAMEIDYWSESVMAALNLLLGNLAGFTKRLMKFYDSYGSDGIGWWFWQIPYKVWSKIREWLDKVKNVLSNLYHMIVDWITRLLGLKDGDVSDIGENVLLGLWDGIKRGYELIKEWWESPSIWELLIEWFKDLFDIGSPSRLFENFGIWIIEGLWNGLSAAWENVKTFFSNIGTWVSNKWTEIKNKTAEIWTNIKTWLTTTVESIRDKIATVFTVIKSKILYIWESIKEGIKSPINGILGFIESFVNKCIDGINGLIDKINGIADVEFKNPFNNQTYTLGFNIPKLNNVSIPRLAQGAVIPPNREFMAVLGDQSHGTNVEAPLDTIKQAVAEVLANNGNEEVIRLLQQLIGVVESKNLVIGDKEIGKANARYVKQQTLLRGATY